MIIYENALAQNVLEYLYGAGYVMRKNLYTPFVKFNYKYYASIVNRLVKEEYIETIKINGKVHLQITEKGVYELTEKYIEKDKSLNDIQALNLNKSRTEKRKVIVADVVGLCMASGIISDPQEKPPLEELLNIYNRNLPDEKRREYELLLMSGVFYSTGEIRTANKNIFGESEIANWTRLVGVVFMAPNVTYIYSVDRSLIKWVVTNERKAIYTMNILFTHSNFLSEIIRFNRKPSCIVCGKGFAMIPKLIYGRKWGKLYEGKKDEMLDRIANVHINARNLSEIFESAYYVTTDRHGVACFLTTLQLDKNSKEEQCETWFEKSDRGIHISHFGFYQGVSEKKERIVYMPYIDLIELQYYKKQSIPCRLVIPKGTQEAISRVMGEYVISMESLAGEQLKYSNYDRTGAKIETDY